MNDKTKKILKITIKTANVLVVIGAVVVLGYYLGWKNVENNLKQEGFDIAIIQISNQVLQTGEVSFPEIKNKDGEVVYPSITLIKK